MEVENKFWKEIATVEKTHFQISSVFLPDDSPRLDR